MKHEIEIPDLPEDWEAVAYRNHNDDDDLFINGNIMSGKYITKTCERLIVRKKQPRRIVLEETDIDAGLDWNDSIHLDDIRIQIDSAKVWKIVEDNKCAE